MSGGAARQTGTHRIDDIEVLRAIAVIFVIVSHAGFVHEGPRWLARLRWHGVVRPQDGVDLFLVISGFVIGRTLLPELERARAEGRRRVVLTKFFIRRIWRLWPAAWLWLAIILAASLLVDLPLTLGTARENAWGAVSAIGLFANVRFAADNLTLQYFGAAFPYWSLSLEEQFYLVLPALILLSGRFLPLLLVIGILVQWPLPHGAWLQSVRTAALMWGVLLAVFERTRFHGMAEPGWMRGRPWLGGVASLALLVLLLRGTHHLDPAPRFEFGDIAFLSAALVWLASYDRGYICPPGWLKRALVWVGARSYSLYLVHIPGAILATQAVDRLAPAGGLWLAVFADIVLVTALADATYRLVEQPCRRYGLRRAAMVGR